MKELKLDLNPACSKCQDFDDCENCKYDVDKTYISGYSIGFTMTYGELLEVKERDRDDLMKEVLRILEVAERVGRRETDYGEYVLALEDAHFDEIMGVEYRINGEFRTLDIDTIPAAFAGDSDRKSFRVIVTDFAMGKEINTMQLDAHYGMGGVERPYAPWRIWLEDDIADNLVEESERMAKVVDHYGCSLLMELFGYDPAHQSDVIQ